MYPNEKKLYSRENINDFTLPRLHKGKEWYVSFTIYDPVSDRMRRKKYMLTRYKRKREREDMACVLITKIYNALLSGWNPFVESRPSRQYLDFDVVMDRYKDYVIASERKGALRHKTAIDYLSRLNQFREYISASKIEIHHIHQFDRNLVVDFLDYLILDRDVTANTRNNYRTWLSVLSTWLVDRRYIDVSATQDVHAMRESVKYRDALTERDLKRLKDYTSKEMPYFYLACMIEYYTFIRPEEIRHIKIGHISVSEQTIYVPGDTSKNHKEQVVALNDSVIRLMIELHVFDHASEDYLFGRDLRPGPEQLYVNQLRLEWKRVRGVLGFPDSYQFYSLKDTGIRDLANSEGIVVARDQARHSDIGVTNRYLKTGNQVHESTKHYKGGL